MLMLSPRLSVRLPTHPPTPVRFPDVSNFLTGWGSGWGRKSGVPTLWSCSSKALAFSQPLLHIWRGVLTCRPPHPRRVAVPSSPSPWRAPIFVPPLSRP